jgi:hypothetical protein
MTDTEREIITNVIRRLKGASYSNPALPAEQGISRIYLDTWVIPALHILCGDDPDTGIPSDRPRDLKLARGLSGIQGVEV